VARFHIRSRGSHVLASMLCVMVYTACESEVIKQVRMLPPSSVQRTNLEHGEFKTWMLSTEIFLEVWGPPTFEHRENTTFFVVRTGKEVNYMPSFRVALGETPAGWNSEMIHHEGRFLAYADRGELLGFINDRFVYRERMSAEQLEQIRKRWEQEERFKLNLDKGPPYP